MKILKLLVILAVLLVIVVIGGIATFITFADPNDFKEEIATRVFEKTGRALILDGELEWALWPKITIKAGPLTLSNVPGFGDEPFFAAEEIRIAVATLPLLKKQACRLRSAARPAAGWRSSGAWRRATSSCPPRRS